METISPVISSSDVFPTSTPALSTNPQASYGELVDFWNNNQTKVADLDRQLSGARRDLEIARNANSEFRQKIANVRGYLFDVYTECGEVSEELREIADLLGITLLKEIHGTATYEISWTASVPLDFDADDFEISFDVNCDTYEAEDFDYNEDNCEVRGEEA